MKACHLLTAAVVGAVAGTALLAGCRKQETPAPKPAVAIAAPVRAEAEAALTKGARFLLAKQLPDGSWIQHPAITALAAMALAQAPGAKTDPAIKPAIDRALDFVVKFAKPDGSIWNDKTDDYPNYSTSIATLALAELNRPQDQKILRGARDFLLGSQFKDMPSSDASVRQACITFCHRPSEPNGSAANSSSPMARRRASMARSPAASLYRGAAACTARAASGI